MLAWDLARSFEIHFPSATVVRAGRESVDITREESVSRAIEQHRPDWVCNAAAYTNVDGAETETDAAFAVNAQGPEVLTHICAKAGARIFHFGTDQVFDGKARTPRREDDPVHPLNQYARSKYAGETAVLKHAGNLVLRVQWLYGERKDRFTPLRTKTTFSPFSDQYGAPTWTREIAQTVSKLMEKQAAGLFHFAYDDFASWAEVFTFVKEQWHLPLVLEPKETASIRLPAARPLFSVLSNEKLKNALGVAAMGSWKTPLGEFLRLPR